MEYLWVKRIEAGRCSRPGFEVKYITSPQMTPAKILVQEVQRHARPVYDTHTTISDDTCLLALPLSQGETELSCDGRLLRVGKVHTGMIGYFPPSAKIRSVFRIPWHSVRLAIPLAFLRDLLPQPNFDIQRPKLLSTPCKEVVLLSRQLQQRSTLDPLHQQLFLDGITRSFWATLNYNCNRGSQSTKRLPALAQRELARCIDFAEAHMQAELDLPSWSASLQLSPAEFSRRFHAATGKSPYRWFLERRLDRAKEELLAGAPDLAQVARHVGFASQSHFTEAFRRYTGLTPGRWRATYFLQ